MYKPFQNENKGWKKMFICGNFFGRIFAVLEKVYTFALANESVALFKLYCSMV